MSVPPLRLGSCFESYISGEVKIHPSAVIAPGVIIQAATGSKIVIGAGVCIGMGSVIQLDAGTLEIEAGANLGAGFLMVGEGKIGANACIGAATTVFRCSVAPNALVAPGSILGDNSRDIVGATIVEDTPMLQDSTVATNNSPQLTQASDIEDVWGLANPATATPQTNNGSTPPEPQPQTEENPPSGSQNQSPSYTSQTPSTSQSTESTDKFGTNIYGQTSVQRLLVTLFPHRQSLNKPLPEDD